MVAACGDAATTTTVTVAPLSTFPPESTSSTITTPPFDPLPDFERGDITVAGETWRVALALTIDQRAQGLMNVTDLGDAEGMLFVFPFDTSNGFWMKDTLIPLEIAFFDSGGNLVTVLAMEPCEEDPCPTYSPGADYRYALEAPPGRLATLGEGTVLDTAGL